MPRFVVLEHDWPSLHWDLLLEAGPVLRAWRLLEQPAAGRSVLAQRNGDHRLHYLDYEGPVGDTRGAVHRWDAGTFDWIRDEPGQVAIQLSGKLLSGHCILDATSCLFG